MAGVESQAAPTVPQWPRTFERALSGLGLAICLGLFVYKLRVVERININWDEFLFLSNVHALSRDEFSQVFQGAYTHAFLWLTSVGSDEIAQIVCARIIMVVLLGVTAGLIWRLGREWLEGFPAIVPPLAYLSALPVVQHGGEFRADSLIAPLVVASLVFACRSPRVAWRDWSSGALFGVAIAVTVKSVLLLPVFMAVLACRHLSDGRELRGRFGGTAIDIGRFLLSSSVAAAALLILHRLTMDLPPAETITGFGGRAVAKTLLDVPLFAQGDVLQRYVRWQPLIWLLLAMGTIVALHERRYRLAALSLALLPIAVYRNAFPYFYVVMLAPAVPLAGFAVKALCDALRARSRAKHAAVLLGAIAAGLAYQTAAPVRNVSRDEQSRQRAIVDAVHRIFPNPAAYIDRCGMIATFRKANHFMSTWGIEEYRAKGVPFMPRALSEHQPAFVLVNTPYLDPETRGKYALLEEDRDLIERFYPVYWGPIRVAGSEGRFDGRNMLSLTVPFAAEYRLKAEVPVTIDRVRHSSGDLLRIQAGARTISMTSDAASAAGTTVALILADAGAAPETNPPDVTLFTGL